MARPLKSDDERRDFTFRVRANKSEKTRIEQNAANAGQEPSVFLRSLGTGARPTRTVPTPDRELLLRVLAEINKNGSNLNQIARMLNSSRSGEQLNPGSEQALTNAFYGVDTLTRHLMDLLKKW